VGGVGERLPHQQLAESELGRLHTYIGVHLMTQAQSFQTTMSLTQAQHLIIAHSAGVAKGSPDV
jgi:hypothetical protein